MRIYLAPNENSGYAYSKIV